MPTPIRFTVRQTLLTIALIAIALGAFRYHISLGSFVSGVLALTAIRTRQVIDGFRKRGLPMTRRRLVVLIWGSLAIAAVMIGGGSSVGLDVFGFTEAGMRIHARHRGMIDPTSMILAIFTGFGTSVVLRLLLWRYRYPDPPAEESA